MSSFLVRTVTTTALAIFAVAGAGVPSAVAAARAPSSQTHLIAHRAAHVHPTPRRKTPRERARPARKVTITVHRARGHAQAGARGGKLAAATPQPPFSECPAVGLDTSCGILIQVNDSGAAVLGDPSQPPFDGIEDTLIGVLNSSSTTVTSIALSSSTNLFGFDGDGLCVASPAPPGCPFGSTGYEGPGTSFTSVTPDQTGGIVTLAGGLAPGQTAYFSLEEPLSATQVVVGGPSAGEQGGAANPSENPTTCSTPRPVNCATGVFWHTFTDVSVPGRGVPLSFSRTYSSSQAATDGPLGYGWTDNYNMSLSTDNSGNVTIAQEDGSTVTFAPNGSGGFSPPPRVLATLVQNPDGSYTFTRDKDQIQYNFSSAGQLTSIADLNGDTTTLTYNGSGQLTAVTDPAGRQLTFTYTGSHIASVTDPMSRTTSFAYDGNGNLVSTTDAAGRKWSLTYDSSHQLLTMTDPRGGTTTNVYNGSGQVTSQTDPDGNTTAFAYSGDPTTTAGGVTTMTDPNGNVTTYTYSDLELMAVTKAAGTPIAATTNYTYDPATLGVTSVTDPNGNVTTSTYDANGNLLTTTDPMGDTTSYDYNSFNQVLDKFSPLGETTSYSYDANGNLLSVTDPLGNTTTYTYGDSSHPGDVTSMTDPNGNTTSYTYDTYGDLASTSVSPSSGVTDTTAYAYDADGERTCQASPNATAAGVSCPPAGSPRAADTTSTVYNAAGEIASVTDADGHTISYAYDGDGNQIQLTDPAGNVTTYSYNGDNQRIKTVHPGGSTQASGYDADGNLIAQTDPNGNTVHYTYNALNEQTSRSNPLGQTTSYAYDSAGNRTGVTVPSGATTTFSYDAANELTGIAYSDGVTPDVSYAYDADGQRVSMTDGTGTTSYSYDADNHLVSTTDGNGDTISYSYDSDGHVIALTYPDGNVVSRSYDGAGRLVAVSDWLGGTTSFSYDADGNLVQETYPNGVTAQSSYDQADHLTSITDRLGSSTLATFAYTRDSLGQVTSASQTGQGTTTYSYTQLNQVASESGSAYSYDSAGNLTQLANGTTQSFNAADELTSGQEPATVASPSTDQVVTGKQTTPGKRVASPAFTTRSGDELLLAFVSASGPARKVQTIRRVTGGGLKWKLVRRANRQPGTAEVWQAYTPNLLTRAKVVATLRYARHDGAITVASFTGAATAAGASAAASGRGKRPAATVVTTGPDSVVWAAGEDATRASKRRPAAGQSLVGQVLDRRAHATYWAQRAGAVTAAGTSVTIADGTAKDQWNMAAVEIPAAPATPVQISYSYDSQGNLTKITPSSGSATTLGYDQASHLTSYNGSTYGYNGDGLRMFKTVGATTTSFSWDTSGSLPLLLAAGSMDYVYGAGGRPIEQIQGGAATCLLTDQQGSVRLLTNSAGAVIGTYGYSAYGATVNHSGAATALQFDGQYTDAESGLIYLRARYYDPSTGQFLSVDPAVQNTGQPYAFTFGNPVNLLDPSGLWATASCVSGSFDAHLVIGGGVTAEVCTWTGSGGWSATTVALGGEGGLGIDAGPSAEYSMAWDPNASGPAELQGPACGIGGTADFFGGVAGNVGFCGGFSAEGGVTADLLPGLSGNLNGGYTWVVNSSTGYHSSFPGVNWIYNHLPSYMRGAPQVNCGQQISGPDGTDNFGLPSNEGYA